MQQSHRTQLVSGWFDCRIYRNGVAKEARPMKQDGDTVAFSMSFAEYPQEFADAGGAEYIKSKDANGLKRYYVSVKVGRICAFFDKSGKKIDRPKNVDIDGKRYDCIIQYKVLNGILISGCLSCILYIASSIFAFFSSPKSKRLFWSGISLP